MLFIYIAIAVVSFLLLGCLLILARFIFSPMPAVKILRKGMAGELTYPQGYAEKKQTVQVLRDLPYPSSYGRNVYDLYLPKSSEGRTFPVVLWIHGGAFVAGDKRGVENWATLLASEGLAVAAMEYQWAPELRYPGQVEQALQCCKALLQYGSPLDTGRIILAGDSAGAHIAAQLAELHTHGTLADELNLSPILPASSIMALLLYCGPYDIKKMGTPENRTLRLFMNRIGWSMFGKKHWENAVILKSTSISSYVTPELPPCYITDGNAHSFESHAKALADKLRHNGVPVRTRFFPPEEGEVTHEYQFSLSEQPAQLCLQDTLSFLRENGLLQGGHLEEPKDQTRSSLYCLGV